TTPRVVFGVPLYNHAPDLPEALESVLTQSYRDFRVVCVDDQSTDATPDIVRDYATRDPRIRYVRNTRRLGMIDNWRRTFELALEETPDAEYFAWASDHDIWHPRWLECLVGELDRYPDVVMAYPRNRRIGPDGVMTDKRPWTFDTLGVGDLRTRFVQTMRHMSAGNMIYGLGRVSSIRRAGVFRRVLVPDRLLLMELSLEGQFRQVPEVLWFRRWYGPIFSLKRQRRAFFPNGRPLYAYVPWWISHATSLTWTLGVEGARRPEMTRWTGFRLGLRYLRLAGLLHFRAELKQRRLDLFERVVFLKPIYLRWRGRYRGLKRRLGADTLQTRWRKSFGSPVRRRRFVSRVSRLLSKVADRMVWPVGRLLLRMVRALPLMQSRIIPWLVRQEIDEVPSGREVGLMLRGFRQLAKTEEPIIVGPWLSEVGFEVLYWIPFLTWATDTFGIPPERLIVVSRGGAYTWYRELSTQYVDIFDLMSVKEFRQRNDARWQDGGNQKQMAAGAFDDDIIGLVKERLGLTKATVLHPSVMYRLLRYYWAEKGAISLLKKHTVYRQMPPIDPERLPTLPPEYVAVRFYFRPSFPDTATNRAIVGRIIRTLARQTPVVLLNPGLSLDDHEDFEPGTGLGIYKVDHVMTPTTNLEVQSAVIANARAFVGTYGGLAYLGPFYGVPSVALFSREEEIVSTHLDVSRRLSRELNVPLVTLDVKEMALVEGLFDHAMVVGEPLQRPRSTPAGGEPAGPPSVDVSAEVEDTTVGPVA
ncbi:MAG: glycosyltransferase family 2 protein, partial [Acidobacteriota bacterium]|nr:glycosyltransferase family 2 protein [Acidobacteriota bacterium]